MRFPPQWLCDKLRPARVLTGVEAIEAVAYLVAGDYAATWGEEDENNRRRSALKAHGPDGDTYTYRIFPVMVDPEGWRSFYGGLGDPTGSWTVSRQEWTSANDGQPVMRRLRVIITNNSVLPFRTVRLDVTYRDGIPYQINGGVYGYGRDDDFGFYVGAGGVVGFASLLGEPATHEDAELVYSDAEIPENIGLGRLSEALPSPVVRLVKQQTAG